MSETRHPTELIVNFRDVGESLQKLANAPLFPEGVLYRGGRLKDVREHEELLNIPTILNLRTQKNPRIFSASYLRAPAHDSSEIYNTSEKATRKWLNKAMNLLLDDEVELPLYAHCTSGKDRTGVFIAAVLLVCGIPEPWIIKEYMLSEGDVEVSKISRALEGMQSPSYFRKVDTVMLREKLLHPVMAPPREPS